MHKHVIAAFATMILAPLAVEVGQKSELDPMPESTAALTATYSSTDEWRNSMDPEFLTNEDDLMDFNNWVSDTAGTSDGYLTARNNPFKRTKDILWSGESPLKEQIAAEGRSRDIEVQFTAAKYSFQEQHNAMDIIEELSAHPENLDDFIVADVQGEGFEFSGLIVEGSFAVDRDSNLDARYAELAANLTAKTGVDIRVQYGATITPDTTRSTDSGDLNAGGFMTGCSSGFALHFGSDGTNHTTTARHCRTYPFYSADNPPHTLYGTGFIDEPNSQSSVLTSPGFYWAFDGAWNTVNYHKSVQQTQAVAAGDYVCTDGGNSGVHCNIYIDNTNSNWSDGYGFALNIRGHQSGGTIAQMGGDSGGPVIYPYANGKVGAVGMIQGGAGNLAYCGTSHSPNPCGDVVLLTSTKEMITMLFYKSASLRTF